MRNFKIGSGEAAMRFNGDDESAPVTWNGETSFSLTQKGLVLPNVATASLVADPPDGTVVYDTTAGAPKWFDGSAYQTFGPSGLTIFEEDVWTPNLWDGSSSSSESQGPAGSGYYTRMGRLVFITGVIDLTTLGTLTTSQQARIGPLPYASTIVTEGLNGGIVVSKQGATFNHANAPGTITGSVFQNYIKLNQLVNSGTYIDSQPLTVAEVGTGSDIRFHGFYII